MDQSTPGQQQLEPSSGKREQGLERSGSGDGRIRQILEHLINLDGQTFLYVQNIFNISYSTINAAVSLQLLQGFPCFSQVTKQTASLEIYKDKDTTEDKDIQKL